MRIEKVDKDEPGASGRDHILVLVDEHEALTIIVSLAQQIQTTNPNTHRAEHHTPEGTYFSICVMPQEAHTAHKR